MILIVEDERTSRRALSLLLAASGHETAAVASAEEALDVLHRGEVPDVALVDLDLPGMNGLELIQRLRKEHPEVRPVIISASGRPFLADFLSSQRLAYVRKPIDFPVLLDLLTQSDRRGN